MRKIRMRCFSSSLIEFQGIYSRSFFSLSTLICVCKSFLFHQLYVLIVWSVHCNLLHVSQSIGINVRDCAHSLVGNVSKKRRTNKTGEERKYRKTTRETKKKYIYMVLYMSLLFLLFLPREHVAKYRAEVSRNISLDI